jgi:hypothetical protein
MASILILIRAALLYSFMLVLNKSYRLKIEGREEYDRIKAAGGNVLFAVWHRATFIMFYLYRGQNTCIVTTPETRGRVLGKVAEWMGYINITMPVSSDKLSAARSFARMVKTIRQSHDAVIAVDGPYGPPYEVKPGGYYLSEKANIPILPIGVEAPLRITLPWRWDKYFVPLPFSTVYVRVGKRIKPGSTDKSIKTQLERLSG